MGTKESWDRFERALQGEHSGWQSMRQNVRLKTKEEKAMEQKRADLRTSEETPSPRFYHSPSEEEYQRGLIAMRNLEINLGL